MAEFTRTALLALGILSLIGGVIGAIDSWPGSSINSRLIADAAKTISFYWLASGIVSWALFWGLAAIIEELTLARQAIEKGPAKELRAQTELLMRIEALAMGDDERPEQIDQSEGQPLQAPASSSSPMNVPLRPDDRLLETYKGVNIYKRPNDGTLYVAEQGFANTGRARAYIDRHQQTDNPAAYKEQGQSEWEYNGETITKRGHDYYIGDEPQSYATLMGARASIDARGR